MVNKRVQNAVFGCNLKNDRMILVGFQGKPFNITVIQVYAPTTNAKEAEQFYEDLQDLLELTPKRDVLSIIGDCNAKVRSQEIPGVTGKFGLGVQNEAGQRLTAFSQKSALTQQTPSCNNKREDSNTDITRWSILKSDRLYTFQLKMEKLYTVSKNKTGS